MLQTGKAGNKFVVTKMLVIKEHLKEIYGKLDIYITSLFKFLASYLMLTMINTKVGYMEQIENPIIMLILALLCTFLPNGGIVLVCAFVMLAHFYAISLELAVLAFILFLLMFCLYIRFDTSDSYIIFVVPLLFWIKLPYLAPLLFGLVGGMAGAVPVAFGVITYYLLDYVNQNAPALSNSTTENMLENVRLIIDGMMNNKLMLLTIIAFVITVILVHIIKSLSVDYAWAIAIGTGTVVDMVILLVGDFSMDISGSIVSVLIGSAIAAFIMAILQFFLFSVDYSRTEHVEFEDDDYVYYVKAVPKMSMTTQEVNVKRINAQKNRKTQAKH